MRNKRKAQALGDREQVVNETEEGTRDEGRKKMTVREIDR